MSWSVSGSAKTAAEVAALIREGSSYTPNAERAAVATVADAVWAALKEASPDGKVYSVTGYGHQDYTNDRMQLHIEVDLVDAPAEG